ncbi:hypothetical protein [Helicobacter pylori]|uniref:hypothetical protein n=1 Tax=Helicobacter pylori TaxID=210 RepID=UPI000AD0DE24|nr:hypothetical protein [Helicobacter pylori]
MELERYRDEIYFLVENLLKNPLKERENAQENAQKNLMRGKMQRLTPNSSYQI